MFQPKSNLSNFLLVISLFGSARVLFTQPVEIYLAYIPMVLLLPLLIKKYFFPKSVFYVFLILLTTSLFNIYIGLNTGPLLLKIFLGLFFSYLFFYAIIRYYDTDIKYLFNLYLKASVVISFIGLFQFLSFQLDFFPGYTLNFIVNKGGFTPGGNFGIRISSVFSEPTYFATFISPAIFVAVNDLISSNRIFFKKWLSIVIIGIFLLTFSGNAYNALFIIAFLFIYNFGFLRYSIIGFPIIIAGYFYAYENINEFKGRVDGTISIFQSGTFKIGITHGSSVNLYDNYQVSLKNLAANPLFGTGLGSHPIAFDKYTITKHITQVGFAFNRQDANSMFLRAMSETGIFGAFILLFIVFKFFVSKNNSNDPENRYWVMSNAILVLILLNYIRQGHYFLYGFPFYIWLYYFIWKKNRELDVDNSA